MRTNTDSVHETATATVTFQHLLVKQLKTMIRDQPNSTRENAEVQTAQKCHR